MAGRNDKLFMTMLNAFTSSRVSRLDNSVIAICSWEFYMMHCAAPGDPSGDGDTYNMVAVSTEDETPLVFDLPSFRPAPVFGPFLPREYKHLQARSLAEIVFALCQGVIFPQTPRDGMLRLCLSLYHVGYMTSCSRA